MVFKFHIYWQLLLFTVQNTQAKFALTLKRKTKPSTTARTTLDLRSIFIRLACSSNNPRYKTSKGHNLMSLCATSHLRKKINSVTDRQTYVFAAEQRSGPHSVLCSRQVKQWPMAIRSSRCSISSAPELTTYPGHGSCLGALPFLFSRSSSRDKLGNFPRAWFPFSQLTSAALLEDERNLSFSKPRGNADLEKHFSVFLKAITSYSPRANGAWSTA